LSTSPLIASFWNHAVGSGFLTVIGLFIGGLIPAGALDNRLYAYLGSLSALSSLPPEAG
jgi:transporter family-2 protein